jgi:hypothetical protein
VERARKVVCEDLNDTEDDDDDDDDDDFIYPDPSP